MTPEQASRPENNSGTDAGTLASSAPATSADPPVEEPGEATAPGGRDHAEHCFVVMPFGDDHAEQRWFRGWYNVVIKPAVVAAGYEPILAVGDGRPDRITDSIREHLALDPMVVVDLGGLSPAHPINANVMYELGLRHAFDLPAVILAWRDQRLPFDVLEQRVIMEVRDFESQATNVEKLTEYIRAAQQGSFFRPMRAVGRIASLRLATESLGEASILRQLVELVSDLKATANPPKPKNKTTVSPNPPGASTRTFVKRALPRFAAAGGSATEWQSFVEPLAKEMSFRTSAVKWKQERWETFLLEARGRSP